VLGKKIGVFAQAIARALDLEHDGVVKQSVEQRRRHDRGTENPAPFGKAAIGLEDHGAFFISDVDELEEQIAAPWDHGEVTDLSFPLALHSER
jgi:hypothetical protein